MKSTSITSDGSQFNSIDLTNSETFATYMEGVTMPLIPSIVFAKESSRILPHISHTPPTSVLFTVVAMWVA